MYNLLLSLLSSQSIQVSSRISINLVQLTRSNALCQSMKQAHSSSSTFLLRYDTILSTPVASVVTFPLLNLNWSSSSTYSIFLSIHLRSTLPTIFVVCAVKLIVWWSLHCVAFVFCDLYIFRLFLCIMQRRRWGFGPSGIWCFVCGRLRPVVSKDHGALIVKG